MTHSGKISCNIHNRTLHRERMKILPCPLLAKGSYEKIPLPLPSPARGEGKHNELEKEVPSPLRGEGGGGGGLGIYSQLQGGWGNFTTVALIVGLVFLLLAIWGCDYARMNDQESVRTYKKEIPEMPPETIPITGGLQILSSANPKNLKNPLPYSQKSVERGKETFLYFCVHCHGPKADGNGTVGQSFSPLPTNLADLDVQKQGDGELFSKISLGFARHPPLASTVSEPDRWAVVNYIRSLKKSG